MVECTRCALFEGRTRVVPGSGPAEARLLLVGEAPGAQEDRIGVPFVGASGRLLDEMLRVGGLERERVFVANVVRCRPPGNRNPRAAELRSCAGWLAEQIRIIRPALIATLGRFALQHFVPGGKVSRMQGEVVEVAYGAARVSLLPLLHPSAVLRTPTLREEYEAQFRRLGRLPVLR